MAQSAEIRIGELSRLTGCNVETVRYYERVGLLPRPPRSAAQYRLYNSADVRRLAFVRRARELGFTLDEIRTLLALAVADGENTCAEVTLPIFARRSPICALSNGHCRTPCSAAMPGSFPAVR